MGASFEYELVDPFDLDLSLGFIDGVTGGRITESYRGDYRSTAFIDIDGELPPIRPLVRIWHVDGSDRTEMGTFTQGTPSVKYVNGRTVGFVPLYSAMYRLDSDLRPASAKYAADLNAARHFEAIVKDAGGTPWVHPELVDGKAFGYEHTWEGGASVLSECHRCADALNGMVGVDSHGRVTIDRYQSPANRSDSFAIDSDTASITRDGVSITTAEWFNCAVVSATVEDKEYAGVAKVDETHPLHLRRIGYWKTDYSVMVEPPESGVQVAVDAAAKARLAEVVNAPDLYSADMLYQPIKCGEVGTFWYQDSLEDEGLYVRALVTQREIDLTPTMRMRVTFEEVKQDAAVS